MCADPQCKSHVVAERADVGAGIALDAEQDEAPFTIENIKFPDGTDTENTLDRTLSWRALVESARKLRTYLFDSCFVHITVKPHQADIFLVMLEEERGEAHRIAEHDEEHTGDLRVERSCMPNLAAEHLSDPCRYLVAGWTSWLVNDDDPGVVPQMDWLWLIRISGHFMYFLCLVR
jgi:hypothetical protein